MDANGDGLGDAQSQIRTLVARSLFSDFHNSRFFAKHVSDGFHIDAPSLSEIGRRIVFLIHNQIRVPFPFVGE
ncbi:MAG: hypothetical protein QOG55_720 [Acidobacteriaceae bacterium]|nr:hypothetical protein [Acidobacteriaceae bacterium]